MTERHVAQLASAERKCAGETRPPLPAEARAQLQRGLERFFTLSPDVMCVAGCDGRFKQVNPAFEAFGHDRQELLSGGFLDFVHPDDQARSARALEALTHGEPTVHFENRYRRKDGCYRWFAWTAILDPDDSFCAQGRDITETRVAAESLRQTNQFLDAIIENIPHMVFVKDAERLAFVRFNRAGEELLGVSRSDLLDKSDYDFFPKEQAEFFQAKDRETLGAKVLLDILEEPIQTPLGPRLLHTKKVPLVDEGGTPRYLLGISEDITVRKAHEEVGARLAAIVNDSGDAIVGLTLDGIVTSWNRSAERMFSYTAQEMVGNPISILFATPEHQVLSGHDEHYEKVGTRKDGRQIDVAVTVSPVRDAAGKLIGVSKIIRDITELNAIQRELVRAKEATEVANRELEAFSYSVAHDLRSPLRSIDGFSQALLEDYSEKLDGNARKYLGFVRESAQLMAQLIDDMLMLSRVTRGELQRRRVDLSELVRAAFERLAQQRAGTRPELVVAPGISADGDARLLGVLFDNLIGNAWKFSSKRDAPRIEFGVSSEGGQRTYFVRDNGAGFDMAYAGKLFGVFQRLHATHEFEGTGVGLATVQRIVTRHGGRVWAQGQVDAGATFYFTLDKKEGSA